MPRRAEKVKKPVRPLKPGKPQVRKKPKFRRSESWRYVRVKERWRAARGIDSKARLRRKSQLKLPGIGYRVPRGIRFLHPSGLQEVLTYNPESLDKIDPKKQAVRIAHTVGARKRIEILEKAREMGILVLSPGKVETVESKESEETGR